MFDGRAGLIKRSMYIFFIATALLWLAIFLCGLVSYEGSRIYYCIFSVLFLTLLLSGLYKPTCYSYLFLSVMLWLGFWLKLTYHVIFNLPYQEAIGAFVNTPESMDHVVIVAIVGCVGVLIANVVYRCFSRHSRLVIAINGSSDVPLWYRKNRKVLLYGMVLCMLVAVILNFRLGIFHVGVVPKTILIWPLNAMISWLLSIGFALMVSTILWWDVKLKESLVSGYLCVLLEALMMSVTVFSRALYLFHVSSAVVSLSLYYKKTKPIGHKKILILSVVSVLLFAASLQCVSILRGVYYERPIAEGQILRSLEYNKTLFSFTKVVNQLIINRWMGVEGVMAVSSYPAIGWDTFHEAFVERSEIGKVGIYQKIAQSQYQYTDNKHFQFSTVPGLIAFLYISSSYIVVGLGAFIFTLAMILAEKGVLYLTYNPFTCALFGMTAANTVAQFGISPMMIAKQYFLIFAYLGFVYLLQHKKQWLLLTKLKFNFNSITVDNS